MYRLLTVLLLCACLYSADIDRQRIIEALRSGNPQEAERLSSAALRESASDPALWSLNAMAHQQLRQNDAALTSFQRALRIDGAYLPALEGASELLYARGSQSAVPLLKRIVERHPGDPTSHAMLAALAYRRDDCATAVSEFSQAEQLIASDPRGLRQQGTCLLKLGKPEGAIPVFEKVIGAQPNDPKSRYELAIAQLAAHRLAAARETLSPLTTGAKPDSQALNLIAQTYEAQGDTASAVKLLREAILANPDLVGNYLDFASLALIHRSAAVGVDVVSLGLRRIPRSAPLCVARGILYVQLGQYDKSDQDFLSAEKLDPSSVEAPAAIGMEALQKTDLPKAEAELRSRIARQPRNAGLYYLLGETLLRRGAAPGSNEFKEAVAAAQKSLVLDPQLESARDLLGRLYLENGEISKAIEQSRLAVKQNPEDQSALYHLILALRRSGDSSDLPALTQRLTQLRASALRRESDERRFALVEESK